MDGPTDRTSYRDAWTHLKRKKEKILFGEKAIKRKTGRRNQRRKVGNDAYEKGGRGYSGRDGKERRRKRIGREGEAVKGGNR